MKYNYFILLSFLLKQNVNAQNLVNNPSFDCYNTYVDSYKNIVNEPKYWYYNTKEFIHPIYYLTNRYLNESNSHNFHPDSKLIQQGEKTNYISLPILPKPEKVYTELSKPLLKGENYSFKLDIKATNQSNCLSDLLIGFKDCFNCNMDSFLFQLRLIIPDSVSNDFIFRNWVTLKIEFIATGNEKVLVIGSGSHDDYMSIINSNLNKFTTSKYQSVFRLKYFVDNVCLTHINSDIFDTLDSIKKGEKLILKNIYFKFDKYELLSESFPMLNKIVEYLKNRDKVKIRISGYTDNIGSDKYNIELSKNRAKSVVDYLINNGIEEARLSYIGYGSSSPIGSNNTEEGRQKNRRIEIKIIEK